jgi:hypothetical protein
MYCPTCGSDNPLEVRFCRRCGTSLEAVSLALSRQGEDRPLENTRLSQLIRDYYSGRHEMVFGLGSVVVGITIPAILLAVGRWGFFWIFLWIFMGALGNGFHQFNKGWKKWNDASSELKAMGYDGPPAIEAHNASPSQEYDPARIIESRNAEAFQQSDSGAPPSVTESTTRHLDAGERK